MLTMHPCIMLGSYILDRDRLPDDEFRRRLDDLHAGMDAEGLGAMLVYGDAREHGALAWLTNFIPRMRWAMALLPRHGAPRLLCSISSRDIPAMRTMTWIEDVHTGWEWHWFDGWLAALPQGVPARIATLGFDLITPSLHRAVRTSLGESPALVPADHLIAAHDRAKRPREVALLRTAGAIAADAATRFAAAWRDNHDPEAAALAAERLARGRAAQDVRTLVSFDGGHTMEPYRGRFDCETTGLTGYIAVKYAGYWAESFVSAATADRVERGLDTLIAAARPGVSFAELRGAVDQNTSHPMLAGQLVHAIGLSLEEGADRIVAGGVYSLRYGIKDGGIIGSAMIHVTERGTEVLCRVRTG